VTPLDRDELVSPELALVDPVLRRRLLAIGEEFARTSAEPAGTPAAAAPRAAPALVGAQPDPAVPGPVPVDVPQRRVGLGVVAVASTVAFVLGAKVAGPSSLSANQAPGAAPARLSSLADRGSVDPAAQRLAWPAVRGATGYEVAIYGDRRRVFASQTASPSLRLAPAMQRSLPRGPLTWYVWAIRAGVRDTTAVVESPLSLPKT
jgi:hypothetical protein